MIQVYLTKQEKNRLKREAKVNGMTMSTLTVFKFLTTNTDNIVLGTAPKNRKHKFQLSLTHTLQSDIERTAFAANTPVSQFVRELIVNN
jgi:hypothetical protein